MQKRSTAFHPIQAPDAPTEQDKRELIQIYDVRNTAIGGINWKEAPIEKVYFRGFPHGFNTIQDISPGSRDSNFPALDRFDLSKAHADEIVWCESNLESSFRNACADANWPIALRYGMVQILNLRSIVIQDTRKQLLSAQNKKKKKTANNEGSCDPPPQAQQQEEEEEQSPSGFSVLRNHAQFPTLPSEIRSVYHNLFYGTNRIEQTCRAAVGVVPIVATDDEADGLIVGYDLIAPIPAVASIYLQTLRNWKKTIDVNAVVTQVISCEVCMPFTF